MLAPGLFFSKASLLLLFDQVFTISNVMQKAIWAGHVLNFLTFMPVVPIEAYFNAPRPGESWEDLMLTGKPHKAITWGVVQSVLCIVLDLYLFVLPLPSLLGLNLSSTKRTKIMLVFGAAFM